MNLISVSDERAERETSTIPGITGMKHDFGELIDTLVSEFR